jgi:tRNA pseudouridine38-40 synthase
MIIAYEGGGYQGWQIQADGGVSIQGEIEKALMTVLQEPVSVIGSGRTDAGVHAEGQVAHFITTKPPTLRKLQFSLNSLLPPDIRILRIGEVDPAFHAQYSALSKIYRYRLDFSQVLSPFKRRYVWHLPYLRSTEPMKKAAPLFLGTHDFTSFANEAHRGVAAKDPVRTLLRLDLLEEKEEMALEFEADGFLYKMVRNIVGTLVECALGKREVDDIPALFAAKDRKLAGSAAPPQGLTLVEVHYP